MTRQQEFWLNGHHCEIRMVGREQYEAYFDGDRFGTDGRSGSLEAELRTEAKYRVERAPDRDNIADAIEAFLERHVPGRNEANEYVMFSALNEEVVLDDKLLAYEVCLSMESAGRIEMVKAYSTPNYETLLRPTGVDGKA